MNSQHWGFFRSKGGEENGVRIGLNGRVVGDVNLFKAGIVHELVEVPE